MKCILKFLEILQTNFTNENDDLNIYLETNIYKNGIFSSPPTLSQNVEDGVLGWEMTWNIYDVFDGLLCVRGGWGKEESHRRRR